jgi:prolyl 4-hydroxylase
MKIMASPAYEALVERIEARDSLAVQDMIALAGAGDPDAQHKAAELYLRGLAGAVDTKRANRWMSRAAAQGHVEAQRAIAYFTASGLGCRANPDKARNLLEKLANDDRFVAVQLAFLGHVQCKERLATAPRRLISADPHIELIAGLFSPSECRYIQLLAQPWLEPAMIYATTGEGMRDPHRDSDNMVIAPMTEDLVIQAINGCIANASGTKPTWGEPLHVLRYGPGQQYRPHHDAHTLVQVEQRRIATALLYLNDEYQGGETHFPEIGVTVRGGIGDLLIFHNLDAEKLPDRRMIHAGLPITRGEKWLATRWIRGSDYLPR